jgi:hypothetical protein
MDPAFDATQAEREACAIKMVEDIGAWKGLKVKAGEAPTVFTIGVIPASTLTLYEDQCGPRSSKMLYWLCFKRGVQGLTGYPPAWLYNEKEPPMIDPGNGMPKHISAAWLEQHFNGQLRDCGAVRLGPSQRHEVGNVFMGGQLIIERYIFWQIGDMPPGCIGCSGRVILPACHRREAPGDGVGRPPPTALPCAA